MHLKQIIDKTSTRILIFLVIITVLLTGASFFLADKLLPKIIPIVFGVSAIIGFIFIYKGSNTKVVDSLETLHRNVVKLNTDLDTKFLPLENAPAEFEEMNSNLTQVTRALQDKIQRYNQELEENQKDFIKIENYFLEIKNIEGLDQRVQKIISILLDIYNYKDFYYFAKNARGDKLERLNPSSREEGNFNEIVIKEQEFVKFTSVFNHQEFQVLDELKNDPKLKKEVRNWARLNDVSRLYALPVASNRIPYGILLIQPSTDAPPTTGELVTLNMTILLINDIITFEKQSQRVLEEMESVHKEHKILLTLQNIDNFEEMCRNFLTTLSKFINMDWGSISVYDENENIYLMHSINLREDKPKIKKSIIPIADSSTSWVWENRQSRIDNSLENKKEFTEDIVYQQNELNSRIITPIYSHDRFKGSISVASSQTGTYSKEDSIILENTSRILGSAVEHSIKILKSNTIIEDLKTSNDKYETFYKKMSHELRNPLKNLDQILFTLKNKSKYMNLDQLKKALSKVELSFSNFQNSLQSVIDYALAEAGKLEYNPESIYIVEILKAALWECQYDAKEKNISLKLSMPRGMSEIIGDKEKLQNAFKILIDNAIQNTPENGTIQIKVIRVPRSWLPDQLLKYFPKSVSKYLDSDVDHIVINISDTGPGIPLAQQKTLFLSPRDVPQKLEEGPLNTTFGLPLVKQVLELHQGAIWVKSLEGSGTTYGLNLPQYGKVWATLRTLLKDSLEKAKMSLSCLTFFVIDIKNSQFIKQNLSEPEYKDLFVNIEEQVRKTLRHPQDKLHPYSDKEILVVISESDIKEAHIIKQRIFNRLNKMKVPESDQELRINIHSITYPDEILNVDDLIKKINRIIAA
ncbi:MAG: ATP-binding protein [Vulcanimicrobiota bacterium]